MFNVTFNITQNTHWIYTIRFQNTSYAFVSIASIATHAQYELFEKTENNMDMKVYGHRFPIPAAACR